jgi:signal peptidase II
MRRYSLLALIPLLFVLDRWTKALIVGAIPYLGAIEVTPFFSIVHVRNTGGVFGLLSRHPVAPYIFTVLPLIVMAVLLYVVLRSRIGYGKRLAMTLILSGAVGNMYDRLVYGYVVDFLDVYVGHYHWPAFNVADSAITVGIGLWIVLELFGPKEQKERAGSAQKSLLS